MYVGGFQFSLFLQVTLSMLQIIGRQMTFPMERAQLQSLNREL